MIHVATMDSDIYIKYGLPAYFDATAVNLIAATNINELTLNLRTRVIDAVVMELFSDEDDIFDCIEFVRLFSVRWPHCKLIIYTQIKHLDAVKLLFAVAGCQNIVSKQESAQQLSFSLFSAGQFLSRLITPEPGGYRFGSLTPREWCVIRMMIRGMTQQKIASRLCISNKTVSQHINNIEVKFGVQNRLRLQKTLIAIQQDIHTVPVTVNSLLFQ